jgi:SAM-dependent methyltransferase
VQDPAVERYLSAMAQEGRRPGNLRFAMRKLFDGVDLEARTALDIGAGEGETSLYAASAGARRVVALEPEAAGSRADMRTAFERVRGRLGADQIELWPVTLQDFDPGDERFDVLISKASINHLNEDACIRLHKDPEARRAYREILAKLAGLANPGADLVIEDCGRRNLFGDLGITNPVASMIEWEKHQSPHLWAELLCEVGFREPRIRWITWNTLRRPGQLLLGNRVGAYLTWSVFWLQMKRA